MVIEIIVLLAAAGLIWWLWPRSNSSSNGAIDALTGEPLRSPTAVIILRNRVGNSRQVRVNQSTALLYREQGLAPFKVRIMGWRSQRSVRYGYETDMFFAHDLYDLYEFLAYGYDDFCDDDAFVDLCEVAYTTEFLADCIEGAAYDEGGNVVFTEDLADFAHEEPVGYENDLGSHDYGFGGVGSDDGANPSSAFDDSPSDFGGGGGGGDFGGGDDGDGD